MLHLLRQNLGQSDGVCGFINFIASPVVGLGDLSVQDRHVRPDELALFLSQLLFNQRGSQLNGIIQDIKGNLVPVPLGFRKDAVFALFLFFNAYLVLCQTAKHVFAFADVDDLIVNADFVNAGMLKLCRPSLAFQSRINAVFISNFY